jgi:hypothetical protein
LEEPGAATGWGRLYGAKIRINKQNLWLHFNVAVAAGEAFPFPVGALPGISSKNYESQLNQSY